jgi:hypothetical protein
MNARVLLLALGVALAGAAGAQAACPPGQARGGCAKVDLGVVPEISQKIVAQEGAVATPNPPLPSAGAATQFYTGPMLEVTTNKARRAPTIGYHWSID